MAKPYDTNLIMIVAQRPFNVSGNTFCNLIPFTYVDGGSASSDDFPNDGQIWWMLQPPTQHLAQPGCLVVGRIEDSEFYGTDDPVKSFYQVERSSVREVEARHGFEVIDLPADAIESIFELVDGEFTHPLDFLPTPRIAIRWRSQVFMPFRAIRDGESEEQDGVVSYSFRPELADHTIYRIDDDAFMAAVEPFWRDLADVVSLVDMRRAETTNLRKVRHELVLADGWGAAVEAALDRITLVSLEDRIKAYAKQVLTRKQRRELRDMLDRVRIDGRDHEIAQDLAEAVPRMVNRVDRYEDALQSVADALLESGMLGEKRLEEAEARHAEEYIRTQATRLQAQIDAEVEQGRERLRELRAEIAELETRIEKDEVFRHREFEAKLEEERAAMLQGIEIEEGRIDQQRGELERQQAILQESLEKVTTELRSAGDDVVNKYLAIKPLLDASNHAAQPVPRTTERGVLPAADLEEPAEHYSPPEYVRRDRPDSRELIAEQAFFDRFQQHVSASGFSYRGDDLKRFHLCVKLGEMTVLGGPSGTGKSSLPMLYGRALAGEEPDRPGCLMVNVNPSWLDPRDLLGHLNTIDRRFYPSETGLFRHLVDTREEHRLWRDGAAASLVCLDEMNLSQVEHYFSDFMMILERTDDARMLHCFDEHAVGDGCPYRRWSKVRISPAVSFVGTVNFDESTRLLSDRLLDRINLIQLQPDGLAVTSASAAFPAATGRPICLADVVSWRHDHSVPQDVAALMDALRPVLSRLGSALSPRVQRAILGYVRSATGFFKPEVAFDLQLAQRVLPKIRGVLTRRRLDALDELDKLLECSTLGIFEVSRGMIAEIRESSSERSWLGEE